MTNRPDGSVLHARIIAVVAVWAAFVIIIPLAQGLDFLIFGTTPHMRSEGLAFLRVMALLGAIAGALTYAAMTRPFGWFRSYLFGVLMVLMMNPDMDEFIQMTWPGFVLESVINALIAGIPMGAVLHLVGRVNRMR